jgi:hypothetical protein
MFFDKIIGSIPENLLKRVNSRMLNILGSLQKNRIGAIVDTNPVLFFTILSFKNDLSDQIKQPIF